MNKKQIYLTVQEEHKTPLSMASHFSTLSTCNSISQSRASTQRSNKGKIKTIIEKKCVQQSFKQRSSTTNSDARINLIGSQTERPLINVNYKQRKNQHQEDMQRLKQKLSAAKRENEIFLQAYGNHLQKEKSKQLRDQSCYRKIALQRRKKEPWIMGDYENTPLQKQQTYSSNPQIPTFSSVQKTKKVPETVIDSMEFIDMDKINKCQYFQQTYQNRLKQQDLKYKYYQSVRNERNIKFYNAKKMKSATLVRPITSDQFNSKTIIHCSEDNK